MFTSINRPARTGTNPLEALAAIHPISLIGRWQTRTALRTAEDVLARMPPHLRDDIAIAPYPAEEAEHPALTAARHRASRWP